MTHNQIEKLKEGEQIFDPQIKGLHIKARKFSKVFYFAYKDLLGTRRCPSLGNYPEVTVKIAREKVIRMKSLMQEGKDPAQELRVSKVGKRLRDLFDFTYQNHWQSESFSKSKNPREVSYLWKNHISPEFGHVYADKLERKAVRKFHQNIGKTAPRTANRCLSVISKIYNFALEHELLNIENPCKFIKNFPEKKRNRFATEEEIKKIFNALDNLFTDSPFACAYIYCLLFTGSRPKALLEAKWSELKILEVKGENVGVLTFHGKTSGATGEDEKVIFPPQALNVIDKLPRVDDLIFGIKTYQRTWAKVQDMAGVKDLWLRDLRRTFATVGLSNDVSAGAIGELLNHRNVQTTKIYAKLMDNSRIEAVSKIAGKLESIAEM